MEGISESGRVGCGVLRLVLCAAACLLNLVDLEVFPGLGKPLDPDPLLTLIHILPF